MERQSADERASLKPPEPFVVTVERGTVERRRTSAARAEPWTRATLAPRIITSEVLAEKPDDDFRLAGESEDTQKSFEESW